MDNKFKTIGYKELDTLLTDIGLHVYYKKNQCVLEYFGEQFNLDEVLNINGNYHYILRVNYKECNGNAVIVIKQLNNFGSEGKYASIIKYKDKVMCIKDTLSIPLNDSIKVRRQPIKQELGKVYLTTGGESYLYLGRRTGGYYLYHYVGSGNLDYFNSKPLQYIKYGVDELKSKKRVTGIDDRARAIDKQTLIKLGYYE